MMKKFVVAAVAAALITPAIAEENAAKTTEPAEPRALIMDILGASEPKVEAFDELADGASILLEAKAEMMLTFYPSCEDLTIRGGRIKITDEKLVVEEGEVVSRTKGQCPGDVKLSPADVVNASVVTRALRRDQPTIAISPTMIGVAGPGASKYEKVGVYNADGAVFEGPIVSNRAIWPEGTTLEQGKTYTIVLTGKDLQTYAARVSATKDAAPVTMFRIK